MTIAMRARYGCLLLVASAFATACASSPSGPSDPSIGTKMLGQTVNAIETERYDPSLPLAFKVARLFKLQSEQVFSDGSE